MTCEHIQSHYNWVFRFDTDIAFARHCSNCGTILSLGPSNDSPPEVQIEIRAAELEPAFLMRCNSTEAAYGWRDHPWGGSDRTDVQVGWLSKEISTHDSRDTRDATAWPWDPSRPVAGQYEEWAEERRRQAYRNSDEGRVPTAPIPAPVSWDDPMFDGDSVDLSKAVVVGGFSIDTGRGPYRIAKLDHAHDEQGWKPDDDLGGES